jgi:hypothetical protein
MIVPVVKCVPKTFKESLQAPHPVVIDPLHPVAEAVDLILPLAEAEVVDLILPLAEAAAPGQGVAGGPGR